MAIKTFTHLYNLQIIGYVLNKNNVSNKKIIVSQ